jgi:hypothetical protein
MLKNNFADFIALIRQTRDHTEMLEVIEAFKKLDWTPEEHLEAWKIYMSRMRRYHQKNRDGWMISGRSNKQRLATPAECVQIEKAQRGWYNKKFTGLILRKASRSNNQNDAA